MTTPAPASADDSAPLTLPEGEARGVLLVRALEESDPDESELPRRARRAATDGALEAVGDDDAGRFLAERARRLLHGREHALQRPLRVPPVLFLVLTIGFGLCTNLLGPARSIHVLWNPVLALVAWSLAVYLVLLVRRRPVALSRLTQRARVWLERRFLDGPASSAAAVRFLHDWGRATQALRMSRARLALHVGAALVAVAALSGMYLRGLVFEYRATWESTFLTEEGAERALRVALAPALLARGAELPDLATIEKPNSGPAAWWVHSYAWTVLLVVLLPRAAFAAFELRRARSLARAVAIDAGEPYYRRLLAPARGEAAVAVAVPYARPLDARAGDALRGLMSDLLGRRARFEQLPVAEYGAEAAGVGRAGVDGDRRTLVIVFPLAQSPEDEVHGRLVGELKEGLAEDEALLVLIDAAGYRERLGAQADERLEERRRNWDRVLGAEGLTAAHVDLEQLDADNALTRLAGALWTR